MWFQYSTIQWHYYFRIVNVLSHVWRDTCWNSRCVTSSHSQFVSSFSSFILNFLEFPPSNTFNPPPTFPAPVHEYLTLNLIEKILIPSSDPNVSKRMISHYFFFNLHLSLLIFSKTKRYFQNPIAYHVW